MNSRICSSESRSRFCIVMTIHPQHASSGRLPFQAHPALETNSRSRLGPHWKRTSRPGSSRIGQFSHLTAEVLFGNTTPDACVGRGIYETACRGFGTVLLRAAGRAVVAFHHPGNRD